MHNLETNIQVVLYIANKLKEKGIELGETKLYKLLWFASLRMADNQGDLILQDVFIKKQFGPVPENLHEYISDIKETGKNEYLMIHQEHKNGYGNGYLQNTIEALQSYNEDFLTNHIKKALDETIKIYAPEKASKLSDMSHSTARKKAEDNQVVDITEDMVNQKYKEIVKEEYQDTIWILMKIKYAI